MTPLSEIRAYCEKLLDLYAKSTPGFQVVQQWVNPDALVVRAVGSGIGSAIAEYGPLAKDDAAMHAAARNIAPALAGLVLELPDTMPDREPVTAMGRIQREAFAHCAERLRGLEGK